MKRQLDKGDTKQYVSSRFNIDNKYSRLFKCSGFIIKAQLLVNNLVVAEIPFDSDDKKEEELLMFFGKEPFHCALCSRSIYIDLYYVKDTPFPSLHIGEINPITWDMINDGSYTITDEAYKRLLCNEVKYLNK
jgi:hypothetical protein